MGRRFAEYGATWRQRNNGGARQSVHGQMKCSPAADRYFNVEIERPRIANIEAWYRRLQDRPAYRQHVMVPFDDLYGRLDY